MCSHVQYGYINMCIIQSVDIKKEHAYDLIKSSAIHNIKEENLEQAIFNKLIFLDDFLNTAMVVNENRVKKTKNMFKMLETCFCTLSTISCTDLCLS